MFSACMVAAHCLNAKQSWLTNTTGKGWGQPARGEAGSAVPAGLQDTGKARCILRLASVGTLLLGSLLR